MQRHEHQAGDWSKLPLGTPAWHLYLSWHCIEVAGTFQICQPYEAVSQSICRCSLACKVELSSLSCVSDSPLSFHIAFCSEPKPSFVFDVCLTS